MSTGICLIGAGRIGRIHAANIARHPHARLAGVVDVDADSAAELADRWQAPALGLDQALAAPSIDAVIIATSTDTHLDLIEAWAAAGKPILCEKPLDLDVARARRSRDRAAAAGVPLLVGFNRRFDPSFRRVRDEVRQGRIGAVEVVSITSRDPTPPPLDYVRRSGGLFRDMTIHDLDMARWLLDEEPARVFAAASCLIEPGIGEAGDVDTASLVLETASGRICQITNSRRCRYGYDQRLEVFGAEGMLQAGNRTATTVQHVTAEGFLAEPALPFFLERYADAYRLELDAFVDAIAGSTTTPLATAEDGVRALLLAEAAERSIRENQAIALDP